MNTSVNFELAKLLKEKGFDNYCDKKYIAQCLWQKPNSREKYKNSEIHKNSSDVSAPTIAEVVMWLYEKHNVWISVVPYNDEELSQTLWENKTIDIADDYNDCSDYTFYHSPTEAYEAAIEYTLNNLI